MNFDWLADLSLLAVQFYTLLSIVIRVASLLSIPLRHPPAVATAWLLVILLWPWPGFLAYALLGSRMLPAVRLQRHRRMAQHLQDIRQQLSHGRRRAPQLPPTLQLTVRLAESLGNMGITSGNLCRYLDTSESFFSHLVSLIDGAKQEVNMIFYIFSDVGPGRAVVSALGRAAARGVTCRLIVDSVGSSEFIRSGGVSRLKELGVQVREALPVRLFRRKAERYDLRNHRKLVIVDRRYAVTGSHNLCDPTFGRRGLVWQDLSVTVEGPVVHQLEYVFLEDWHVETGELLDVSHLLAAPETPGNWSLQTVPSGPSYDTENYLMLVLSAIMGARRQVTITTPYLIPTVSLIQAMQTASRRGVRIRLLVPAKTDHFIVGNAAKAYYSDLLAAGVKIFLYHGGMLHAKTITVDDDLAFVGSSNFDTRSFALNFEISLVLYGTQEAHSLLHIQNRYLRSCVPLNPRRWSLRGRPARAVQALTRLLSPLL
ncbi:MULTISPECIES: cardiolipin synthase [Jonquetella]|uniref:Cardiolipin synthase n=1 Tax=Jonquetella anthropi DSM 22815 TaxID=885272 RepID=H0ULJ1_9BACT|nr:MULTISPECIES: cardiolipin synthase [Jonquetella]EEX49194.1 phospholipase D domain protein [Jonquetella anthropi E3_33 E1]EHM12456.1 phosphatidylserine/phosphatidylglycerophosphate/cardiolipin synthase [Jonquetella anthropi DSM 22815]ERL24870.1 cardiolipin synthetase [Jonquetella sp. BV3C21]